MPRLQCDVILYRRRDFKAMSYCIADKNAYRSDVVVRHVQVRVAFSIVQRQRCLFVVLACVGAISRFSGSCSVVIRTGRHEMLNFDEHPLFHCILCDSYGFPR